MVSNDMFDVFFFTRKTDTWQHVRSIFVRQLRSTGWFFNGTVAGN